MALAPPWADAPPGFVLDGAFLSVQVPATRELVRSMLVDLDDPSSGLMIVATCCGPGAWPRLVDVIMRPGSRVDLDLLNRIADAIIKYTLGTDRWVVARLWQQAVANWLQVDGELQLRGVDVLSLPPGRATNAVYALIRSWQAQDKTTHERWQRKLDTPPLRVINQWKRDDTPVETASPDAFAELINRPDRKRTPPKPPAGATITMPTSDTLRPDTDDQRELPSR